MQRYLNQIVENALDFLDKSISEFEKAPKYALLHFYSALELFLKARLFHEHWTLIIDSPDKASVAKLEKGDFQSVNLAGALTRLHQICESRVPHDSQKCFEDLRKHRNQIAHFYSIDAQHEHDLRQLKSDVAALICKGWYFLHKLIDDQWAEEFSDWKERIAEIESKMRAQSQYLEAKWNEIKSAVGKRTAQGCTFICCPGCGFPAMPADDFPGPGTCCVCTLLSIVAAADCPACGARNFLVSEGVGNCSQCKAVLLPEHIWATVSEGEFVVASDDPADECPSYGSCGECGGEETLIYLSSGWLCTQCLVLWADDDVGQCDWCLGYGSLMPEDSMLTGCLLCDGHLGHMMQKND